MPQRLRTAVGLLAVALLALSACTAVGPEPVPTVTATAHAPEAEVAVLGAAEPAELAVAASEAFFSQAPVAVVADGTQPDAQLLGASLAVALGVPVLLSGASATLLDGELTRLQTETVLAVGEFTATGDGGTAGGSTQESADQDSADQESADQDSADRGSAARATDEPAPATAGPPVSSLDVDVVAISGDAAAIGELLGRELTDGAAVADGDQVAALAGLAREDGAVLRLAGEAEPAPSPSPTVDDPDQDQPEVPVIAETAPLEGLTVLSDGSAGQAAAVGTARAAGASVLVVPSGDPRGSGEAIDALSTSAPANVVGLGPAFGSAETLEWRVATAATGVQLPGGTQLVFEGKRYSALYGTPGSGALGVLGEQGIPETIARARQHAEALDAYTEDQVLPSLEIIASIASAGPGPDGDYSATRPVSELRPLVDAAAEAGVYVVLDLQPGRTDFLTQAKMYEELLLLPHVGLALDPEWRLKPGQVHLRQIGSVEIDEVNEVVNYVADLTRQNRLPQKLFILHQFRLSMIRDRERLDTSRSELAMMIHVDGQGSQPAKNDTWNVLRRDAPDVYWGWKNFYDEDLPMLTPEQTMQIQPVPHLVSYQ